MTMEAMADYDSQDLTRFERALGNRVDFTLTPEWARAAEKASYGAGLRSLVRDGGEILGIAQGIFRRRLGFSKLLCGSNSGAGVAWAHRRSNAAALALQNLIHRVRPNLVEVFSSEPLTTAGISWEAAHTFHVDLLPPVTEIIDRMEKRARYAARRAERLGVSTAVLTNLLDLPRAYDIIQGAAEARVFPLPPRAYSFALHREFATLGSQACVVATRGGRTLSAAALLGYGDKVAWWKGGSTHEGYSYGAGNLVQLAAIRWAKDAGFRVYDLGGTDPSRAEYAGIHQFKASLGGSLVTSSVGHSATPLARLVRRISTATGGRPRFTSDAKEEKYK